MKGKPAVPVGLLTSKPTRSNPTGYSAASVFFAPGKRVDQARRAAQTIVGEAKNAARKTVSEANDVAQQAIDKAKNVT